MRTPGSAVPAGELSKVTFTGPRSEMAWPLSPSARQNGSS